MTDLLLNETALQAATKVLYPSLGDLPAYQRVVGRAISTYLREAGFKLKVEEMWGRSVACIKSPWVDVDQGEEQDV